jgi:hypothetical protein
MSMTRSEPVSLAGVIGGVLTTTVALLAVLWPSDITPEKTATIIALGNAVILAVETWWQRSKVFSPNSAERVAEEAAETGTVPAEVRQ